MPQQIHVTPAGAFFQHSPQPHSNPVAHHPAVRSVQRCSQVAPCTADDLQWASRSAIAAHGRLRIARHRRTAQSACAISHYSDPNGVLRPRAATDFTSVFITWVTGHVTETLPDIPYTATSVYNINPLNMSAPGVPLKSCRDP